MKFKTKLSTITVNLVPVNTCATVGVKSDHDDGEKITLTVKDGAVVATANNGFVAITKDVLIAGTEDFSVETEGQVTAKASDLMTTLKAFSPEEVCSIAFDGKQLIVKPISDDEQEQTLQATDKEVAMPSLEKEFDVEFDISREVFLSSVNEVQHAVGQERYKAYLQFWKMAVDKDRLQISAGCGARFEIYERKGPGFINATKPSNFFVSADHYKAILSMLSTYDSAIVNIREKKAPKSEYASQIVFNVPNTTIVAIGYDPGTKWPDENKFLARQSPNKFTTFVEEWKYVAAGVAAISNKEARSQNLITYTNLDFEDGDKKKVFIKAAQNMTAKRNIKLKDTAGKVTFRCVSGFISDLFNNAEDNQFMQFEFADGNAPVVIRHHAAEKISDGPFYKVNSANGIKEQRVTLIAPSKGS